MTNPVCDIWFGRDHFGITIWVLTVWVLGRLSAAVYVPDVSALCCFSAVSITLSYLDTTSSAIVKEGGRSVGFILQSHLYCTYA